MPKKDNDDELNEKSKEAAAEEAQVEPAAEPEVSEAEQPTEQPAEQPTEQAVEQPAEDVPTPDTTAKVETEPELHAHNNEEQEDVDVDAVTIQPVEFMSFDHDENPTGEENKNLEMLLDIKLELTVELGRCELPIKKILELTRDSIVELDKIAGEPVSLYANGKHIANGEVVVIEDNFGLRITSIIEPEKRLKSLDS